MATSILASGVTTLSLHRSHPFSSSALSLSLSLPPPPLATVSRTTNRCFLTPCRTRSKMTFIVYAGDQVGDLLPLGIHLPIPDSWPAWIPGFLLAVIVPFFTNKWGPFAKFKEELDKVEVAVDNVADRVEEMAEKVEHFVDEIGNELPEDSKLRQTLEKVERVADRIGKDAHMVSDLVDKMDEIEAKAENIFNKTSEGKKTPNTSDVNATATATANAKSQSTNS